MENKMKNDHLFHSRPAIITATKMTAVKALVLNVCASNAIVKN
jgi:hypothetical protein